MAKKKVFNYIKDGFFPKELINEDDTLNVFEFNKIERHRDGLESIIREYFQEYDSTYCISYIYFNTEGYICELPKPEDAVYIDLYFLYWIEESELKIRLKELKTMTEQLSKFLNFAIELKIHIEQYSFQCLTDKTDIERFNENSI